jgi:hypothetical protein
MAGGGETGGKGVCLSALAAVSGEMAAGLAGATTCRHTGLPLLVV